MSPPELDRFITEPPEGIAEAIDASHLLAEPLDLVSAPVVSAGVDI